VEVKFTFRILLNFARLKSQKPEFEKMGLNLWFGNTTGIWKRKKKREVG
jgi:hypothetical protein